MQHLELDPSIGPFTIATVIMVIQKIDGLASEYQYYQFDLPSCFVGVFPTAVQSLEQFRRG
jgi:hypothetical protein